MSQIIYQLDQKEYKEYLELKNKKEEGNIGVSYLKLAVEDLLTFGLYDFSGSVEELEYYSNYSEEELLKLVENRKQGILRNVRTILYTKNYIVQKNIKKENELIITNKNTKEIVFI